MLLAAKIRREEISRKVKAQSLQASGYVRSQLSGLTSPDRLIECDHYMLKGKQAQKAYAQDAVDKSRKELRYAQGQKIRHVKRIGGETVGVSETQKPRK